MPAASSVSSSSGSKKPARKLEKRLVSRNGPVSVSLSGFQEGSLRLAEMEAKGAGMAWSRTCQTRTSRSRLVGTVMMSWPTGKR